VKEARIECVTTTPIPDLGLRLAPGEVTFLPEQVALRSKHLWKIARAGAVKVRWVERYKEMRPKSPPAPFVNLSRTRKKAARMTDSTESEAPPPQPPKTEPGVDVEALVARVREETRQEMQTQIDELKQALLHGVGEIVRDLPAGQPVVVEGGQTPTDSTSKPEATFIPDDLVKKGTKGRVQVEAAESEGGDLDDATAALAALRGKKKKKAAPKKKGSGRKS